ncbi:MAG: hypothetical protein R3C17_02205 [Planctomycetaceae bacterium]
MAKPNTFIIGAPKCGTTALATYLSEHPNAFVCRPKEPEFWADEFDQSKFLGLCSLVQYEGLFDRVKSQHKVIVDASTGYLWSRTAIAKILEYAPAARFIVMLRNPVELAPALHMELALLGEDDILDFEEAWRSQSARANGQRIPESCPASAQLLYGQVAMLGSQLQRLRRIVPESQLHIIFLDDFRLNPRACYLGALNFLQLEDDGRTDFPVTNAARAVRAGWLNRLLMQPPRVLRPAVMSVRHTCWRLGLHGIRQKLVSRFLQKPQARRTLRPELILELKNAFRDDVRLLSEVVGRDLSGWL